MNDVIKRLAEQAGALVLEKSLSTEYGCMDFDLEKFALSIINECKAVIDPTEKTLDMSTEAQNYRLILDIDEYFGL